jgi:hypothetical protein
MYRLFSGPLLNYVRSFAGTPEGEEMEKIVAKIEAKNRVCKYELLLELPEKKELMLMRKIKCLDMLNVPLPLL